MESSQPPPPPLPPPPEFPNESIIQRYKLAWRVFMIANLGLGAYMFARAKKKDASTKPVKPPLEAPPAPPASTTEPSMDFLEEIEIAPSSPSTEPVNPPKPVPEDQQREIFKWILEEKRKAKPKDREEKRRIDEEKAILKRFIWSDSIPPL